ncbi:MAG TPA: response regulator [Cyclobacteriaceae bacterium]|nr:response regulator [Cyclobacteriaceae bacterium]
MSSSKRILLVDDDEDDRETFLEIVSELDPSAVLVTAINGADGFEKLSTFDVLPDVIFLDLNMPIMNGTEFLRKIKTVGKLKNVQIVILSTSSDEWAIKEVRELGAKDFVTKPAKFKDWRAALQRFI